MHKPLHILYLHGLGGSPRSTKGLLIEDRFAARGVSTSRLSLSLPSLQRLSLQRAMGAVIEEIHRRQEQRLVVVGSSFGAFVGLHALHHLSPSEKGAVEKLALLAPVLDPWDPSSALLIPEKEDAWKRAGTFPILELESGEHVQVHSHFVDELQTFKGLTMDISIPTLIVHGRFDETVSVNQSERFAQGRANVRLELLEDDHRLLGQPSKFLDLLEEFLLGGKLQQTDVVR